MRQISCFILFFMITCSSLCTSLAAVLTSSFFFLNDTATTEISPLPLHDALPIYRARHDDRARTGPEQLVGKIRACVTDHPSVDTAQSQAHREDVRRRDRDEPAKHEDRRGVTERSEEHTSELQSLRHLVCRLLLEK